MLIRLASDLHLEAFPSQEIGALVNVFLPADSRDSTSVLVLAGDISSSLNQLFAFLEAVTKRFAHVLYVPGNHEAYKHDFAEWNLGARGLYSSLENVSAVALDEMRCTVIGETRFLFGTLWADGGRDETERALVDRGLNDFRLIRNGATRFTVMDMIKIHKEQKEKLVQFLKEPFTGKTVVVTHHMPSYRLCHPRFGNEINGGFASNCDGILAANNAPDLWIHGHTHDRISTKLWKTQIECNPAGYRGEWDSPYNTFFTTPVFIDVVALS